ncbi:AAA family ATPase [Candidatus Woesearchaeota archaeon]|nr:AAA family ATPase [Candidatus Woesearchaeota archaeon]
MVYKIAIVGSYSTGTSTTSRLLADELKIPIVRDLVKDYRNELFGEHRKLVDLNLFESFKLWYMTFSRRVNSEKYLPEFISDSSTLSELALSWVIGKEYKPLFGFFEESYSRKVPVISHCSEVFVNLHIGHAKKHYEHIFYTPIEFPLTPNGFRPNDESIRQKVDDFLVEILGRFGFNYTRISGTPEERLETILNNLKI